MQAAGFLAPCHLAGIDPPTADMRNRLRIGKQARLLPERLFRPLALVLATRYQTLVSATALLLEIQPECGDQGQQAEKSDLCERIAAPGCEQRRHLAADSDHQ